MLPLKGITGINIFVIFASLNFLIKSNQEAQSKIFNHCAYA